MKGTFFQKPLELSLKVEGESWRQGDEIRGALEIRNHGGAPVSVSSARVLLTVGELKKVRQRAPGAFQTFTAVPAFAEASIEAGKSANLPWSIRTDRNCAITDATASPFLLYGLGEELEKLGQLQVPMHPHSVIEEFLARLEIAFRFVQKSRKTRKDGLEVKLAPPDSKGFSTLELLTLTFRFDADEALELRYQFQIRKIEATASAFDIKKDSKGTEQRLPRAEYLLPSGRIRHEAMETAIRQALELVEAKIIY
ncbi:MAG: hypothetical protein NDJ90_13775 [Oligoflexia bacterium]|nr:hypothetical protein [Oligoflexia bacterium]